MRIGAQVQHRRNFSLGIGLGLFITATKFIFYLPINIADWVYACALLLTLIVTVGDILESKHFSLKPNILDSLLGLMVPLDLYAILILLGIPLTN